MRLILAHETSIYVIHFSGTNEKFILTDAFWFSDADYQVFMMNYPGINKVNWNWDLTAQSLDDFSV